MIDRCGVAIVKGDRVAYTIAHKIQNGIVVGFTGDKKVSIEIGVRKTVLHFHPEKLMVIK